MPDVWDRLTTWWEQHGEAAKAEGWNLWECGYRPRDEGGGPRIEVERYDYVEDEDGDQFEGPLASDEDAMRLIVARARDGSAMHIAALETVDQNEREKIKTLTGW